MYIHYFIILHGFIVVFSSVHTRSSLIFIIKSRHKLLSYSTTTRITTQNCHSDILSQWLRHSLMSTNVNRVVNTTEMDKNVNRTRIRRQFLRENTIDDDDEDDANIYDDDDGRYFRNQQKEIAEQKRGFNDEYHRLIKMSKLS